MKKKVLSLLLGMVLLLAAVPFAATASGGTVLHSWKATTAETDNKVFSSNLLANEGEPRWNETATIYTERGKEQIALHTFLNEVAGRGKKAYGLPVVGGETDNLRVDMFPTISTEGMRAISLSMVYAYKPGEKGLNPANSELLQVYVSENGMNWSQNSVGIRSVQIVGTGTDKEGDPVIYYRIHTEDLKEMVDEYICGVRILPDGKAGIARGTFSLAEVTITGYKSSAAFETAVPVMSAGQASGQLDVEAGRALLLDTVRNSTADTELGRLVDAILLINRSAPSTLAELLHSTEIRPMDGIATEAAERVKILFTYMMERDLMTQERADQLLTEYESVITTADIVKDLNTPQQILRAYGKAQAGDILLQVTEQKARAYMVVKSEPVYLPDRVNVDPMQSKITYLTKNGEETKTFFDAYIYDGFLPMILNVLATGEAKAAQIDVYASMTDGVRVAVTSTYGIRQCEISVGNQTVTLGNAGTSGVVCTDRKLTDAVAALADGKHKLTVTVTSGLGEAIAKTVEFEVKDGKATVLAAASVDHSAVCPSKAMTDVDKNAWYHEAVDYALTNGLMGGYNATTFGPNDTLSRAMVVQVLYNKEGKPAISGKHAFADVPADQWYNNAVTWGTQKGVMSGYNATTFGPDDQVTIEQVAVILWNYSGKPAFTGTADHVGKYSDWAANGLAWAAENDILMDVPFKNATEDATRAQTAQMLMNYLNNH